METYDLVVIGAGNAGLGAAGVVREAGWRVAVVESRDVGGVCPNRGCVPKKVLVAAATALDRIRHASTHHIDVGAPRLDWAALIDRKRGIVAPLAKGSAASLERRGIDLVEGEARFVGPDRVEVGGTVLQGRSVLVAPGSRPRPLRIDGAERLSTSEELLELETLPQAAVFVGAGVVAFEFAHVMARLGTQVTLLEVAPRPLGRSDPDLVDQLVSFSRTLGIAVHTGVEIGGITAGDGGLTVSFSDAEGDHTVTAERVFNGAGRVPNVDLVDLDRAGIALERGRPRLHPHLQSIDNPAVWFAGDALPGTPQLSPVATYEGRMVGHNLLHPDDLQRPDYRSMPSAVFTIPTLAQVGLAEPEAAERGFAVDVKVSDMSDWIGARTHAEPLVWAKVLIDRRADRVVGAHLLGPAAGEVIHTYALAIRHDIPASALTTGLYAYPTYSNDVKYTV